MRTTQQLVSVLGVATALGFNALASGGSPCIDCPTPPPCSAEGACHPKSDTHGYYQQQWRRWPTDREERLGPSDSAPGVPGTLVPDKTIEDRAAPTPSAAEEEPKASATGEGVKELELPTLPALPPIPGQPGAPATPDSDNIDNDPPPGLPPLPGFGAPPGIAPPPRPVMGPGQTRNQNRHSNDAPPPLPAGFTGLVRAKAVAPATYQSTTPGYGQQALPTREPVSPAYYVPSAR